LRTIYIVSSEPYFPWELIVPYRTDKNGDYEERDPLGVEFALGRWVHAQHASPPQEMPILNAYVIVPKFRPGRGLRFADAEAEFVCATFKGERITPVVYESIAEAFGAGVRSLLHFVCHGSSAGKGVQQIDLDPEETLSSLALRGMRQARKTFSSARPFVFLNACELGRQEPALVGPSGFAQAFIDLGARCVVAPLWSVRDDVAHEVASEFYRRVIEEPTRPFADILRDIRKRAYEDLGGEDSFAAYCFYGDPLAARSQR
jgi:CHAT domain-containing protein